MIEDIGPQLGRSETVNEFGLPRMYKYTMSDPSLDEQMDLYRITGLGFEKDTCYIDPLRNGTYCGYSIGFDPVSLPSSQIGLSEDMPSATYRYNLSDMWNKMEHLDNKNAVNPYSQVDKTVKEYNKLFVFDKKVVDHIDSYWNAASKEVPYEDVTNWQIIGKKINGVKAA